MAEKLGLGSEVRPLKLGQSFTNPKSAAFHTIKYDFKPASVHVSKIARVEVGASHQVTVTVPHIDGAAVPQTVFKGSQRPYQKECVLVFDRVTGEFTLEKLSSNIQVKKTRTESQKPQLPQGGDRQSADKPSTGLYVGSGVNGRAHTPPIGQRASNKLRVTSGNRRPDRPITQLVPKHSPLQASPQPNSATYPSPGHYRSPKRDHHVNNESHPPSTLASLPMIGLEDFSEPQPPSKKSTPEKSPVAFAENGNAHADVGEMSSSSSSSESDSDSEPEREPPPIARTNGYSNAAATTNAKLPSMPAHILTDDLRLSSESGDSD